MASLLSESFTTEIPVGFFEKHSSAWADASDIIITYNSGQQAADIAMTGTGKGHIKFATSGTATNIRIVLDLETIAYTNTDANSGVGVGLRVSGQNYNHAFRIHLATANNPNLTLITGTDNEAWQYEYMSLSSSCLVDSSIVLTNGNRNTYEFGIVDSAENDLYKQLYIKVNNTLYWTLNVLSSIFPRNTAITPYFFLLDSTYRMHSVDIYDDATYQNPGNAFSQRSKYTVSKTSDESGIYSPGVYSSSLIYSNSSITAPSGLPAPVATIKLYNGINYYLQTDLVEEVNSVLSRLVYQYIGTKIYPQRGGLGTITGNIKIYPNTPTRRQVFLIRDRDMVCIQEVWSDSVTGDYTFTGIDPLEMYTVVSRDYTHQYNAVIADNLTPT